MRDSLSLRAATAVHKAGKASTRDLEKEFPRAAAGALHEALHIASERGWIRLVRKATRGRKAIPAIWEGADPITDAPRQGARRASRPKVPRVSCVWDLATGQTVKVLHGKGRKFQPLGEW